MMRAVLRRFLIGLAISIVGTTLLFAPNMFVAMGASPTARQQQPSPKAVLKELRGQLPETFDLDVDSPCPGPWAAHPTGGGTLRLMVMRYQGVPIIHVMGTDFQQNNLWTKVGPVTIQFKAGSTSSVISCVDDRGTMTSRIDDDGVINFVEVKIERSPFPAP